MATISSAVYLSQMLTLVFPLLAICSLEEREKKQKRSRWKLKREAWVPSPTPSTA
jgi:hypothetical protein